MSSWVVVFLLLLILTAAAASVAEADELALRVAVAPEALAADRQFDALSSEQFFGQCLRFQAPAPFFFPRWRCEAILDLSRRQQPQDPAGKLNHYLENMELSRYPGGGTVMRTLMAGMEFYAFSKDITTHGSSQLHTGYDFGGRGIRTGIFYKF